MEKSKESTNEYKLIYGIDDKPSLGAQILLGFQNIFAAFGGIIAVPLVISNALGFNGVISTALLSASILASGIATVIQSRGVGPFGAKVPCVMGTDFTFVAPSIAVGSVAGLPGIIGATILGSILEFILSFFIKPLMKLFPPIVTGTVVCLIGLTLLPVSIDWAAGGVGSSNYGDLKNVSIAMLVLIITLLLNRYGKGMISSASILIGMAVGYIICIPLGMVDFTLVRESSWFALPNILGYGMDFNMKYVLTFIPAYFVTVIETVGCLASICEVTEVKAENKIIQRGVLADGVGSLIAGFLGSFPNTTFSQNVGLIPLTKNGSRFVAMMAGIILVLLGFFPKFAALINIMPQPVLGGVGIVMFGTIAAAGIKTLSSIKINNRNLLIIATSIGLGLGVTFRPEFIAQLPEGIKMIFSSGISTGTIVALILNKVLKEEQEDPMVDIIREEKEEEYKENMNELQV
ncbi:uracil-xanthine permease family protein [Eubacterium multiforme]|uniref:NCS2 family nucleobase:cation symporter-2 n=1 Tax=Eubacterium multiforme TaxID=83339 RepID=A0ABT9UVQ9_9FIRM|nr:nucleobase:cation symporter-2 family protein [Eubacterium multiforme]MDQ0150410.1 NCS2 family nucleobase:cation symporter-2 [Eubacterium multiforme]